MMTIDWRPLLDVLRQKLPDLQAVYAFGSQISGDADADSDLDLAVLLPYRADPVALWQLAGALSGVSGLPVDLLDLRAASTVMQYQVLSKGIRLFELDTVVGIFEAMVLSEKTRLDEVRQDLLDDIVRDGRVYGR
ncbi:type VII toxin-antitoxin system MntA family adenylyltransferase antitoxin [Chitinilyticum litopenaei]|uniref:type VII toxin-antitoxin system MntA family adenylyltransferase antitoxin n=1 Tax=Chitinilyticum litopenaei TaxID=1121276 RepID=UPI00040FF843|nr:nucleotidyltransferase domain-containing protein [Chitinilyticum litopenaei]